jgi:hypothetical protein
VAVKGRGVPEIERPVFVFQSLQFLEQLQKARSSLVRVLGHHTSSHDCTHTFRADRATEITKG